MEPSNAITVVTARARQLVGEYVECFKDESSLARMPEFILELERLGDDAFPALAEVVDQNEPILRVPPACFLVRSAEVLRDLVANEWVIRSHQILADVLESGQWEEKLLACLLLQAIGAPRKLGKSLRRLLADPAPLLKVTAAAALTTCGMANQLAMRILREALVDKEEIARSIAAGALARLGLRDTQAMAELNHALAEPNSLSRVAIINVLGQIGPAAKEAVSNLRAILVDSSVPPNGPPGRRESSWEDRQRLGRRDTRSIDRARVE